MLALLPALGPEQRFKRIINRPEAAYMLRSLEPTFGRLPPDVCNTNLVSAVGEGEISHLRAVLRVLSFQDFKLSDAGREALLSCIRHEDQVVRTCAFQLVARSRDPWVLASIRRGNWASSRANPSNSPEGFYGSKALSFSAKLGDYAVLRARITPELWGLLAEQDGSEAAIDAFADDLDLLLRASLRKNVTDPARDPPITLTLDPAAGTGPQLSRIDPFADEDDSRPHKASFSSRSTMANIDHLRQLLDPDAFDRRTRESVTSVETLYERARQVGVAMFGSHVRGHSLPEVIRRRPGLVASWVAMMDGGSAEEVIWRAGDFYRALALSLAPVDPGRAAGIIRRLRKSRQSTHAVVAPMKIDALSYAAWEIPDCPDAR